MPLVVDVSAKVCPRCGWYGYPETKSGGSGCVLVALLFFFIVPGLIYLVWMLSSSRAVCSGCGSAELVEPGSPVGMDLLRRYHPELFANR